MSGTSTPIPQGFFDQWQSLDSSSTSVLPFSVNSKNLSKVNGLQNIGGMGSMSGTGDTLNMSNTMNMDTRMNSKNPGDSDDNCSVSSVLSGPHHWDGSGVYVFYDKNRSYPGGFGPAGASSSKGFYSQQQPYSGRNVSLWRHLAGVDRNPSRPIGEVPGRRSVSPLHGRMEDRDRRRKWRREVEE